jgi:ATP-binding cassette subfamily F protein 3
MIERIHRTVPAYADAEFAFGFPEPERLPSPLVRLDRVQAGYSQLTVLENVDLSLEPGTASVCSAQTGPANPRSLS